jgi:adenine-specific DNA methylase
VGLVFELQVLKKSFLTAAMLLRFIAPVLRKVLGFDGIYILRPYFAHQSEHYFMLFFIKKYDIICL